MERPPGVTFKASVGGSVPILSEDQPSAGRVVVPANATVDQHGAPVFGDIDVYVSFADPRAKVRIQRCLLLRRLSVSNIRVRTSTSLHLSYNHRWC